MELQLACLPCILRQVLEAARMSTDDSKLQKDIMDEAITVLGQYRSFRNPPELARAMHWIVKIRTKVADPYQEVKQKDLQTALHFYPQLKELITTKENRLLWALKVAAIGNVLDSGVSVTYDLAQTMEEELAKPFAISAFPVFAEELQQAKNLLIIGDNTGETVFDRLLLEELPPLDFTYAVRSAPIINDATLEDARASGLDQYAQIISTGCDAPGVLLDECSPDFLEIFHHADIVLCKGQGNYETLSDADCGRDVYFLLKVKCPVLAEMIDVDLNEYVFKPSTTVALNS